MTKSTNIKIKWKKISKEYIIIKTLPIYAVVNIFIFLIKC